MIVFIRPFSRPPALILFTLRCLFSIFNRYLFCSLVWLSACLISHFFFFFAFSFVCGNFCSRACILVLLQLFFSVYIPIVVSIATCNIIDSYASLLLSLLLLFLLCYCCCNWCCCFKIFCKLLATVSSIVYCFKEAICTSTSGFQYMFVFRSSDQFHFLYSSYLVFVVVVFVTSLRSLLFVVIV